MLIRFIFAPFHIVSLQVILFDLAIIVSIKKTVLILELRTLMEGEYLFCLQEYRYSFVSNKICFTNMISSSHLIIPNSIGLSWWAPTWPPFHCFGTTMWSQ